MTQCHVAAAGLADENPSHSVISSLSPLNFIPSRLDHTCRAGTNYTTSVLLTHSVPIHYTISASLISATLPSAPQSSYFISPPSYSPPIPSPTIPFPHQFPSSEEPTFSPLKLLAFKGSCSQVSAPFSFTPATCSLARPPSSNFSLCLQLTPLQFFPSNSQSQQSHLNPPQHGLISPNNYLQFCFLSRGIFFLPSAFPVLLPA